MRKTGFGPDIIRLVLHRSDGLCERCTCLATQLHHRSGRRSGGSRDPQKNAPPNAAALCTDCHEWAESCRTDAIDTGWVVPSWGDAEHTPIVNTRGQSFLLNADGTTTRID